MMLRVHAVLKFIFLSLLTPWACLQPKSAGQGSGASAETNNDSDVDADFDRVKVALQSSWKDLIPKKMVSRFDIDDRGFQITSLVVGYKDYLESQTPYLSLHPPKDADYVQIMRCPMNASISSGMDNIPLADIEISSGTSPLEKTALFRANDYWGMASHNTTGCEIVSLAHVGPDYLDSWAPSGSYRFLVRACVSEDRLADQDVTTSRFCSRQIAVSQGLENYVNKRQQIANEALRKADAKHVELNQGGLKWYNKVRELAFAIKDCEEREFRRAVSVKKKQAIAMVAAASVGIVYELSSVWRSTPDGPVLTKLAELGHQYILCGRCSKAGDQKGMAFFGTMMNKMQLSGEMGGMSFGMIFTDLTAAATDMPRTCTKSLQLDNEVTALSRQMLFLMFEYDFLRAQAEFGEKLQEAMAGLKANAGPGGSQGFPGQGAGQGAPQGAQQGAEPAEGGGG